MNDETVVEDQVTESLTAETGEGAQEPSLDDVLSEIDKEFSKATKTPEPEADEVSALKSQVDYLMNQTVSQDIEKAVDSIASTIGADVPRRAIRGMLNELAVENPKIRSAFENRHNDPATWNKVQKAAAKEIKKEFSGIPDKRLTDDRDAVTAAIRGASKTTVDDEAPNFSKMSDHEYEEWKRTHR